MYWYEVGKNMKKKKRRKKQLNDRRRKNKLMKIHVCVVVRALSQSFAVDEKRISGDLQQKEFPSRNKNMAILEG